MENYFCNAVIHKIQHALIHNSICLAFWTNNLGTYLVTKRMCENELL